MSWITDVPDVQSNVLTESLKSRERGWSDRSDSPWRQSGVALKESGGSKSQNAKRPMVDRYLRIAEALEQSLLNGDRHWVDTSAPPPRERRVFRSVDLFAGCGGLTLGFDQEGFQSVLGVEVDPDAAATFKANFSHAEVWSSRIEDLTDEAIRVAVPEDVHVLLAGFPCQGFSLAGQRDPKDERNVLFREVVRVAKVLKPCFLVLENVPGVVTMSKGKVFDAIISEFAEAGYPGMSALVLQAAAYGVPQLRSRTIFVANRFGLSNPYPAPLLETHQFKPIESAIDDLKAVPRDLAINHDWTHHSDAMIERIANVPPGGSLYESYADAWKRQYRGVPSMTIKENHGATHIHYELSRTLSAREMARLQTFPDSFLFHGRMKRVMFQVGNAVPPLLASHVARAIRPSLESIVIADSPSS